MSNVIERVPVTGPTTGWTWPSCRNTTVQLNALSGSAPSSTSVPSPVIVIRSPATNVAFACGDVIVGVGGEPTVMVTDLKAEVVGSNTVSVAV